MNLLCLMYNNPGLFLSLRLYSHGLQVASSWLSGPPFPAASLAPASTVTSSGYRSPFDIPFATDATSVLQTDLCCLEVSLKWHSGSTLLRTGRATLPCWHSAEHGRVDAVDVC